MRERRAAQRGFTVLELAVVVAIIGILAAIVIPNWASTARNKKYDPEITAMFTEISTREEQYRQELGNGLYLDTGSPCPAVPTPNGIDFNASCVTGVMPFATLRVNATDTSIRCTYAVTAGNAPTTNPTPPAGCTAPPATLQGSWYYIVASCDMDGNGGTNATFCMSSWSNAQTNANYGS